MSRRPPVVSALLLALLAPLAAQQPVKVTLGLYSFKKSTEVRKQFLPVAQALGKGFATCLGKPGTIELQVMKTYEECLDALVAGQVDMVRFGPASYVIAKRREPKIELLAAEREDSRQAGLIVVRTDSPISSLADLAGKKFAFGDEQSTIGRFLSQAELVQAGIKGTDLASFQFLDRHDNVFKAVELGDYAAGALHVDTFKELNGKAEHKLRVLHAFDNAPKPWLARAGLDPAIVQALRRALLALDDPAALTALKVPGFAATTDQDYELVRRGMVRSEQFAVEAAPAPVPAPAPAPVPAPGKGP